MTKRHDDESRDGDEAIWRDAITLSPADTKDARIHVTLRLDPNVYRAVLAEKKATKDRTITSTIERLLSKGLQRSGGGSTDETHANTVRAALRNLVAHSVVQDAVLEMFARHVKPRSSQDRRLVEEFKKHSCCPKDVQQWLADHDADAIVGIDLLQVLLDISPPATSKRTREVSAQHAARSA
ncbi:MAG TPA: hypothetical protein VII30_05160 [Gemmatimonadaceae bacterium]